MCAKFCINTWLAISLVAGADTIYVATNGVDTRTGKGDWTNAVLTIGKAVTLASPGDEVLVSNGCYRLTATIDVNKAIALRGLQGWSNTVVDGNYPDYSNRCFLLSASGAVLDGFTITNGCWTGWTGGGGGVYMEADAVLTNCLVTGNRARPSLTGSKPSGGGVCVNGASLIYNCRIIGNYAETPSSARGGGGISLGNGTLDFNTNSGAMVVNCDVISNNSYGSGGGIYGGGIISNCVVSYNSAVNDGGGIGLRGGGLVMDCKIVDNFISLNSGGGMWCTGSSTMLQCNVSGNTGTHYAGGISTYSAQYALMDRCVISSNHGGNSGGGGVYAASNSLLRSCLIAGNTTDNTGGGVYGGRNVEIQSCTIANNHAITNGGGIALSGTNNLVVNTIVRSNTSAGVETHDVYNTTEEQSNSYSYCNTSTTLPDASNLTNAPCFIDAVGCDYRLNANSPCRDTGTNQNWMRNSVDLDGRRRLDNFSWKVDMGCYEYIPPGTLYFTR